MNNLTREQKLPISLEKSWNFFSNPNNLAIITPDAMDFSIQSDVPDKIYSGLIVKYTVRPLLNIPITWVSEISQVREGECFVDRQIQGPYKVWHHQHHFETIEGGVLVTDIVHYSLPLGILGKAFHGTLVRPRLEAIFEYRRKKLISLFGEMN